MDIPSGLKTTFLVHFIVALVFGLLFLLVPQVWATMGGYQITEPTMYRLVGAAILAFGASSWLGYRETAYERVKIVVATEIVWTVLATLVMVYALLFASFPPMGWINALIMAIFAVLFGYFYMRK